jgi:hypothetical protein
MSEKTPPLSITHPALAREWDTAKNTPLLASDVTSLSQRKVWWRCAKNAAHEWRQYVYRRVFRGCPCCKLERTSLGVLFPAVAREWHPTKNGSLEPNQVAAGSKKYAWWVCRKEPTHVWEASIGNRTARKSGCPYCAGCKADSFNSLASLRPDIAAEWHPSLNKDLTPDQVVCGSDKKVWWLCKRTGLHEWQMPIDRRTSRGQGCTVCRRVTTNNSLETKFPEIAAQWHPTKNEHLFPKWDPKTAKLAPHRIQKNRRKRPSDVAAFSKQYAWWQCPNSSLHVWYERVCNRTSKRQGCPFCAGFRIAEDNNLAAKFPALAKLWHPSRNLPLMPDKVTSGTAKVVWWRCFRSAKHVWQVGINKIVHAYRNGHTGCPFCKGRRAGPDNSLAVKHPELAELWHPTRNALSPAEVTPGSGKSAWWQCKKSSEHIWRATIANVTRAQKYTSKGCPYCSGHAVRKEDSLLKKYPEVVDFWDKSRNLSLRPNQVTCMSNKIVYWRCRKSGDHVWKSSICYMVTSWKKGRILCGFCAGRKPR